MEPATSAAVSSYGRISGYIQILELIGLNPIRRSLLFPFLADTLAGLEFIPGSDKMPELLLLRVPRIADSTATP